MVGCIGRSCFSRTLVINKPQKKSKGKSTAAQAEVITISNLRPIQNVDTLHNQQRRNISGNKSNSEDKNNTKDISPRPVISGNEEARFFGTTQKIPKSNGNLTNTTIEAESIVENGEEYSDTRSERNGLKSLNQARIGILKNTTNEVESILENGNEYSEIQSERNGFERMVQVRIGGLKNTTNKAESVVENGEEYSESQSDKNGPKTMDQVRIESLTNTKNKQAETVVENENEYSETQSDGTGLKNIDQMKPSITSIDELPNSVRRRTGIAPIPVRYDQIINEKLPVSIKSSEDKKLIRTAIEQNEFINQIINDKVVDSVIDAMYSKDVSANEIVIKQGDKGVHMYISAEGTFQILVKGKVVSEFGDVRVFGELAILYNAKRRATIKALTAGKVWVLDGGVYQQIRIGKNIKEREETMNFLMNNETLNVVGKEALQIVANLLKTKFFPSGQEIVKQGDKGNMFYIIRAGTVTITKAGEGVVGVYKKGDCFGELALLEDDRRQATVTANAPGAECLTLSRKEFIDHFGEVKKFKHARVEPKGSIRAAPSEHGDVSLEDLRIRKTLGVGGFGRVELVQHTQREDVVFALKYLKKVEVVAQGQQEHVFNEKNIQMACQSPFIVRLYRTYKDRKYIYFLMESCLGGDLWSLLQRQKIRRFEEKGARFICACVLEAFDYLHSRGIIYRDLKPENLLIAVNGYIKLTDFGFAKKIAGKTYTFAGTPEYVAPEIVLNRGHDRAVDYWAFGAFVFEMLTGRTPFRTDDSSHMRTYNRILGGIDAVAFPSYVNYKAKHLIEKLCRPLAEDRLGMQKGGVENIKGHKWFLGFDWQRFARCELPSPFKPKLSGPVDTKYFDQFKKDVFDPPDDVSGWDEEF